jgi:hypothetical protein
LKVAWRCLPVVLIIKQKTKATGKENLSQAVTIREQQRNIRTKSLRYDLAARSRTHEKKYAAEGKDMAICKLGCVLMAENYISSQTNCST